MTTINSRVKQVIGDIAIEERQLSEILGVSYGYISKYASDKEGVKIPAEFIEKICRVFPVNINWIFTGDGQPFTEEYNRLDYIQDEPVHKLDSDDRGIDTEIADRIRNIRTSMGQTQADFAESMGFQRHIQASIENYRQMPTYHYVKKMFWRHNISVSWLLLGIGSAEHGGLSEQEQVNELKSTIAEKDKFIKQLLQMLNNEGTK